MSERGRNEKGCRPQKHKVSDFYLLVMTEEQQSGPQKDDKLSVRRRALKLLAECHGDKRQQLEAVYLLAQATKKSRKAMVLLGLCCEYGLGVPRDTQQAESLYNSAARLGYDAARMFKRKLKDQSSQKGLMNLSG